MNRKHDRHFLVRRLFAVLAVSAWMATCGDPQTRNPTAPSGPAALGREITGPASIAPGQSAQFTAIVRLGDGITKTLTGVVWRSTNTALLQVTSAGVAVAGSGMGDVTLQADVPVERGTARVSREVVILPDGTYRLVGSVLANEVLTVAGARLDVTPGSAFATTDFAGNYKLYGVPADASIRIVRDGYQPFEQSVHLTEHATKSFVLTPTNPSVHLVIASASIVAIDTAPGCSALPEDLQHRNYQATVSRFELTDAFVQVTLTEPRFSIKNGLGNHFYGRVETGGADFDISGFFSRSYYRGLLYYYYPDVVERLSDGTILLVAGSVTTTGTAAGLSGRLDGELSHYSSFPNGVLLGTCVSKSHQFALTPR
jgi:hypothetical protein